MISSFASWKAVVFLTFYWHLLSEFMRYRQKHGGRDSAFNLEMPNLTANCCPAMSFGFNLLRLAQILALDSVRTSGTPGRYAHEVKVTSETSLGALFDER
jgi:hypothetical protein